VQGFEGGVKGMKTGFNSRIPIGQAVYDYDYSSMQYKTCLWCLFPVFILTRWVRCGKLWLYRKLNQIGIMHTPEGCKATLRDLFKEPAKYKNIIAGYFKYDE
jgi:hypothetical protein